jgi:YbbR domain-containing protein
MILKVGRFIVRNWPLKVGAVLLAAILYVGMVALQTTATFPGSVTAVAVNEPTTGTLVVPDPMPQVTGIRYLAPPDVSISQASFHATIDLAHVPISETQSWVTVQLQATDPRIQIIDYQPQQVRVELDPIAHKTVNVQVVTGAIPSGLEPASPVLSTSTVEVSGALSYVRRVAYAEAQVHVDASGLDVNGDVDLVARDASGAVVNYVTITPHNVHVLMQVGSQIRSETVPVSPNIINSPAAGYSIASVTVTPPVVQVRGQADALALLKGEATTQPISVAGATSDVSVEVGLVLPNGVTTDTVAQIQVVVHLQAQTSTRSLSIGVVPQGTRPDLNYSLSTLSVTVALGGATAALNALDTSTLVATVSVTGLGPGTYNLAVTVNVPPGIKVVAISSGQITVTITVASSPPPPTATP